MRYIKRYFPHLIILAAVATFASLGLIFFYAPVERTMGIVQKIFYVHVPAAMATYLGFTITSVASLLYLLKPSRLWDNAAIAGVETGLIFCSYVLISGPLWAYKAWGQAWVWDPQLTATLVLFLLYGGYGLLRLFSTPGEGSRKVAAVLAVIAFVDIPLVHYAVNQWGGMHPVVERSGGGGLAGPMKLAFTVSMLAFLLVFAGLFLLRMQQLTAKQSLDKQFLEAEDLKYYADTSSS